MCNCLHTRLGSLVRRLRHRAYLSNPKPGENKAPGLHNGGPVQPYVGPAQPYVGLRSYMWNLRIYMCALCSYMWALCSHMQPYHSAEIHHTCHQSVVISLLNIVCMTLDSSALSRNQSTHKHASLYSGALWLAKSAREHLQRVCPLTRNTGMILFLEIYLTSKRTTTRCQVGKQSNHSCCCLVRCGSQC